MKIFIFLFLIFSFCTVFADDRHGLLFYSNFEKTDAFAKAVLKSPNTSLAAKQGVGKSTALKVSYIPSKNGSQRVTVKYKINRKVSEASLNYDVKFDRNFDWAKGGKLHGVGPEKSVTGGKAVSKDSWSVRLMFRPAGGITSYIYKQDKKGKYGDKTYAENTLKKDRYYAVTVYVKINNPGVKDGIVRVYLDGQLEIDLTKQMLRGNVNIDTGNIEYILFNTFHGGHSEDWAPKKNGKPVTCYAYFDNFAVYKGLHIRQSPGK